MCSLWFAERCSSASSSVVAAARGTVMSHPHEAFASLLGHELVSSYQLIPERPRSLTPAASTPSPILITPQRDGASPGAHRVPGGRTGVYPNTPATPDSAADRPMNLHKPVGRVESPSAPAHSPQTLDTAHVSQTIREILPEGFQRSEFLVEHGMIDQIVDRRELRQRIASILSLLLD